MQNFASGCVPDISPCMGGDRVRVGSDNECGTQIINSKIPVFNDDFMEFGLISLGNILLMLQLYAKHTSSQRL